MKKLLIMSLVILGVYSCKNNDDNTKEPIVNGPQTRMTLSLVIPQTYAADDPNASADEVMVKTIDLFIYSTGNTLIKRVPLTVSDFTYDGSGTNHTYKGTTKVTTTTGDKKFYVGVNLPANLASWIETFGPSDPASVVVSDLTSNLDGFAMFSDVVIIKTLTENEATNVVPVTVKRLVAKIAVQEGVMLDKNVAGGRFSELEFAPRNVNEQTFPLPFNDGGVIKDPNWASANILDFDQTSPYIGVNPGWIVDNKTLMASYATENTTQGTASSAYQDEATFVSVKMSFVPDQVIEYTNSTDASGGFSGIVNIGNYPKTFYTILDAEGKTAFSLDKNVLTDWANSKGLNPADIKTYTDGKVYYFTYLNKAKNFNVYRNDFYKVNIKKLIGLGEPTEHIGEHIEIPIDVNMTVDIEILNWNLVEEDADLIGQ